MADVDNDEYGLVGSGRSQRGRPISVRQGSRVNNPNPYYDPAITDAWRAIDPEKRTSLPAPPVNEMVEALKQNHRITEGQGKVTVPQFRDLAQTEGAVYIGLLLAARTLTKGQALEVRGGTALQQFFVLKHAVALGISLSPKSIEALKAGCESDDLPKEAREQAKALIQAAAVSNALIAERRVTGHDKPVEPSQHLAQVKERLLKQEKTTLGMEPDQAGKLFDACYLPPKVVAEHKSERHEEVERKEVFAAELDDRPAISVDPPEHKEDKKAEGGVEPPVIERDYKEKEAKGRRQMPVARSRTSSITDVPGPSREVLARIAEKEQAGREEAKAASSGPARSSNGSSESSSTSSIPSFGSSPGPSESK